MASYRFTSLLPSFAREHEGLVTRRRLLDADFTDDDIADAMVRSLLVPVLRGVYLIGRSELTPSGLRHAATLMTAPSMLFGRSAAEHYGLFDLRPGTVNVSTARRVRKRIFKTRVPIVGEGKPGLIVVRPAATLDAKTVGGIPTSTVPRMLIEIAATEDRAFLERAWKQADYRRILDLAALEQELRRTRREGTPLVRELFLRHPGRFGVRAHFESPAEVDFLQLVADAGLPIPEVNVVLHIAGKRYIADFLWRELGLIAEVDGPSHRRPLARQSDAIRSANLFIAELDVVRFQTDALAIDPAAEMARLAAIIERQRRRAA